MMWGNVVEYVFSHRGDVPIKNFKDFAGCYGMYPRERDIGFAV
jgi:hypothetical protein